MQHLRFLRRSKTRDRAEPGDGPPSSFRAEEVAAQTSSGTAIERDRQYKEGKDDSMPQTHSKGTPALPTMPMVESTPAAIDLVRGAANLSPPGQPIVHQDETQNLDDSTSKTNILSSIHEGDTLGLWEQAYDRLKQLDHDLLERYEWILSQHCVLKFNTDPAPQQPSAIDLTDDESDYADLQARRTRMSRVLEAWLHVDEPNEADGNEGLSPKTAPAIYWFKKIIRPAALRTMQPAVAWVAVCFAAQALITTSSLSGLADSNLIHVISAMEWYCALPKLLPGQESAEKEVQGSQSVEGAAPRLKNALIDFYETVLSYLISLACSEVGTDPVSELDIEELFSANILERERAIVTSSDRFEIEKQLRQLGKSADSAQSASTQDSDQATEEVKERSDLQTSLLKPSPDLRTEPFGINDEGRLLRDTMYEWVVSTPEYTAFRDWKGKDSNCVLWITGRPGAGKSMLLASIVQQLVEEQQQSSYPGKLAYSPCNRNKRKPRNAASVVLGLVRQVLKQQPTLDVHLRRACESTGRERFDQPTDFYAISGVLYSIIQDEQFLTTYFVLDAIDECCIDGNEAEVERGLKDLLGLISITTKLSPNVKWLISIDSANLGANMAFVNNSQGSLRLCLDSNPAAMRLAAGKHVSAKVESLTRGSRYDAEFQVSVTEKFVERSEGNFLWATLACEIIKSSNCPWNAVHILEKLPMGLEPLYRHSKRFLGELPTKDSEYCNEILYTMAAAYRPLHISELEDIVSLPLRVDLRIIIAKKCFTFLELHDDIVSLVHQSAKDFLRNEMESPSAIHAGIMQRCLKFLTKSLSKTASANALSIGGDEESARPAHYATLYWLKHLSKVADIRDNNETMSTVTAFLSTYFLRWLEKLTPSPGLSYALTQISALEDILRTRLRDIDDAKSCLPLVQCVSQFLRFHQSTNSPLSLLQRKNSLLFPKNSLLFPKNSLLFGPSTIAIRQRLLKQEFPWLDSVQCGDQGSSLSLEGHNDWVRYCAYSADGRLLGSCSDDQTVCIWDSQSGELQMTLSSFDDWVYRVLFSSAGLMATMETRIIKIWDSTTLTLQKVLRCSDVYEDASIGIIYDIAFSPDGSKLAAGMDNIVAVWDMNSYDLLTMWMCLGTVRCLRISSDGSLATSIWSAQNQILIWGIEDARLLHELETDEEKIDGLCFSPDSQLLASGADDGKVRIWKTDSYEPSARIFSRSEAEVVSVSFSHDSSRLAAAFSDKTISIWNLTNSASDQPERVLFGHTGELMSLSFSPVGYYLASAWTDHTVRVWDTDTELGKSAGRTKLAGNSPQKHSQYISIVKISQNGKLIASGSGDGVVCLWDGETGRYQCSLRGHDGEILWVFFSEDGRSLGSTATDYRVMIWDIESETQTHCFEGHTDWIRNSVFSPTERFVASASDDSTVRIWNLTVKAEGGVEDIQHRVLKGHTDYVRCVAFSPNGQLLASGGDDCDIRLWDLTSKDTDVEKDSNSPIKSFESPSEVYSVTFSPDGQRIVSSSYGEGVMVWNVQNQERLQSIKIPEVFISLRFNPDHPGWILTEKGAWLLDNGTVSSSPSRFPWSLSPDRAWIRWNDKDVIFIPKQYRPEDDPATYIQENKVVVGCKSGYILLFKFKKVS